MPPQLRNKINFSRINQLACREAQVAASFKVHVWGAVELDGKPKMIATQKLDRYTHVKRFKLLLQFLGSDPFTIEVNPEDIFVD